MKGTFMIVAKCDPYHSQFHYNGQRVLRHDGLTPVWWVFKDNLTYPECLAEFEEWAQEEGTYVSDETVTEDIKNMGWKNYTLEDWMEDNPWYQGEGYYHNGSYELLYAVWAESYHDDVMTYTIYESDMKLRDNTEIYKEIYKKGLEVTKQERAIIESVGGLIEEKKTGDYHAFALNISQRTGVGEDVGESLVGLLNSLGNYNYNECLWYLGDIDKEYVFID